MSPSGPAQIPERADANGVTLVMEAARHNIVPKIVECVQSRHNINAQDKAGNTALIHAAETKSEEAALMLIHHGADMALANRAGETALMLACEKGLDQLVERWAVKNGPLDAQNRVDQRTALMTAIVKGNAWAAVRLIDAGADYARLQDRNGETGESLGRRMFLGDDLDFFKLAIDRRVKLAAQQKKAEMDAIADAAGGTKRPIVAPRTASFRKKPF